MKEGDIVIIDTAPNVFMHAKLKRPLVSGWVVELICDNGVQYMRSCGYPAFSGYQYWTSADRISHEHDSNNKGLPPCDESCVLEEEYELYKTYGGD